MPSTPYAYPSTPLPPSTPYGYYPATPFPSDNSIPPLTSIKMEKLSDDNEDGVHDSVTRLDLDVARVDLGIILLYTPFKTHHSLLDQVPDRSCFLKNIALIVDFFTVQEDPWSNGDQNSDIQPETDRKELGL